MTTLIKELVAKGTFSRQGCNQRYSPNQLKEILFLWKKFAFFYISHICPTSSFLALQKMENCSLSQNRRWPISNCKPLIKWITATFCSWIQGRQVTVIDITSWVVFGNSNKTEQNCRPTDWWCNRRAKIETLRRYKTIFHRPKAA